MYTFVYDSFFYSIVFFFMDKGSTTVEHIISMLKHRHYIYFLKPILMSLLSYTSHDAKCKTLPRLWQSSPSNIPQVSNTFYIQQEKKEVIALWWWKTHYRASNTPSEIKKVRQAKEVINKHASLCADEIIQWFETQSPENEQHAFDLIHGKGRSEEIVTILESYRKSVNPESQCLFFDFLHKQFNAKWFQQNLLISSITKDWKDVVTLSWFYIRKSN